MTLRITKYRGVGLAMLATTLVVLSVAHAEDSRTGVTSYAPVAIKEDLVAFMGAL